MCIFREPENSTRHYVLFATRGSPMDVQEYDGECSGTDLEYQVVDGVVALCPVACEWVQSVPFEDFAYEHVIDCG